MCEGAVTQLAISQIEWGIQESKLGVLSTSKTKAKQRSRKIIIEEILSNESERSQTGNTVAIRPCSGKICFGWYSNQSETQECLA